MSDSEGEEHAPKIQSKRMFINHVDCFHGKNFAKFLSTCVVGASVGEHEEEEEEEGGEDDDKPELPKEGLYEIYGTLREAISQKPKFVKEVIKNDNRDTLYEHLLECDVIVYCINDDICEIDEAVWALSQLHADEDRVTKAKQKIFILVSSVMTWARSKPLDENDPEIPFTEDDYRRRKPHPNFKEHISAEKTTLKLGKTSKGRIVAYVIAAGLAYGAGENIFHYLVKASWHNNPELLCYGDGQNVLPTIHIQDLAQVVQNVADMKPKVKYLVAVDDSKHTLEEITTTYSKALSTGKIRKIQKEEALLNKSVQQEEFDMLQVSLRMDSVFVKEQMHIKWKADTGLIEHIDAIIADYKETRKLTPIRIMISGPPASGKTTVAEQLCTFYKLHHVKVKEVIEETMLNMQKVISERDNPQEEGEEDDDGKAAEYEGLIEQINETKEQNNGRIEDQFVTKFMREKLQSKPCQNQGFVLDGYPKTIEQAKEMFANPDEPEEEDAKVGTFDKTIMPDLIICLDATDDFLRQRVINLPESVVAGTHNTEEGLTRRLTDYRALNTDDDTVMNYFDELEIHPDHMDITTDSSEKMKDTVDKIKKMIGEPRNYGISPEEEAEIMARGESDRLNVEAQEQAIREKQEAEEAVQRKKKQDEWATRLDEVRREEGELIETQAAPLRNYLMRHVMPTLTQGLIDCCRVRPDDAIDYLAEYLFKNNPQVD